MKRILAILFMVFITSFGVTNAQEYVYEPTVLTFTGNTHPNPYTDVIFWTVFTGPTSEELVLHGFWDGGNIWKIRFTPTAAGTWTYTTGAIGDSLLSGKTGKITALESTSGGFIIRDPNNDFAFKRSRGNNIFLMGDTCWNCMSTHGMKNMLLFKDYIDIRVSQGFNFEWIHVCPLFMSNRCPDDHPYCTVHKNEGGYAFGNPWNVDYINPLYYQNVDAKIAYANSVGMTVFLVLGGDRSSLTTMFPTDAQLRRYIEYCVARFGAYDIAWILRMELEEQSGNPVTHARNLGTWVSNVDPYDHLISIHTTKSCADEVGSEEWLDWICHEGFDGNTKNYTWTLVSANRTDYNKPVMNVEFYYEKCPVCSESFQHHQDAEAMRKGAWHLMMEGASGIGFGNTGTYDASSKAFVNIDYATSDGATYMTHLYNFMKDIDYWDMTPSPGNDLLSNPGVQYIAYFEQGTSRAISVSPGCYIYSWYNPRAGTTEAGGSFSGSSYNFVPPDNKDWVLACVKDADACKPGNSDADGVPNDKTTAPSTIIHGR